MPIITSLGPVPIDHVLLCVADAAPGSQSATPEQAQYFFPGAPWVGAMRNTADRTGCKLVVLTTGHGLVRATDDIGPYDLHITPHEREVSVYWQSTIPQVLKAHRHSLMLFYAGGCPRESYLDLLLPNLQPLGISLLTFGRPNMVDINQIEPVVHALTAGTTLESIAARLTHPNRLRFHYHP